jgi:hypothetical protein
MWIQVFDDMLHHRGHRGHGGKVFLLRRSAIQIRQEKTGPILRVLRGEEFVCNVPQNPTRSPTRTARPSAG